MSTRRRVLLDENIPTALRLWLPSVEAISVEFMGWKGILNGELARRARAEGFLVLVTGDRPLARTPYVWSPMGCVYVTSLRYNPLRTAADRVDAACSDVLPGQMLRVRV